VQKILGHHSILTTARYAQRKSPWGDTHLTDGTHQNASQLINTLMNGFAIDWGKVK